MNKLILNTRLITLNEYISIERRNKYHANNKKKIQQYKIEYIARQLHFTLPENTSFFVVIEWFNYRHDSDNVEFAQKFIFDALQAANILENDSKKFIKHKIHLHFKDDSRIERCNVLFFEDVNEFIEYFKTQLS